MSEARDALAIATEHLGLEVGIVSEVVGESYRVLACVAPDAFDVRAGQEFNLANTYCAITMAADELVTIREMATSQYAGHPCYQTFALESYIGVPLRVADMRFGTLNFSATKSRPKYDKAERGLVRLVAAQVESILERNRFQRAAELADARYRALFERSVDAVIVHREGRLLEGNQAMVELLGVSSANELRGRRLLDFVPRKQDQRTAAERFERLARGEVPGPPFELVIQRSDGERRHVEAIGVPVERPDGFVALTLVRDLTDRRESQSRLIQAERLASVGSLSAGIAHELNNPLAYVIANLEVAEEELEAIVASSSSTRMRELQDAVREAREGSERARRIVRDLRTFSRVEDEQRVSLDVHRLIDVAVNMSMNELRHRARLVRSYGDVPLIEADESRLTQVFVNLLVNAAQAIPEGAVDHHEITVVTDTDEQGRCRIRVLDTGTGIPDDVRERVFDPFFTTKPGEGTGLGLSLAHSIIESFGGTIDATNRPERGAELTVLIPAAPMPAPSEAGSALRGRVLVIDDDAMICRALHRVLGRDHHVEVVTSGAEALKLLADQSFDVILCDLMMPSMPGWEVFAQLQARSPALASRVIFLTGGALGEEGENFLQSVPNLCLSKPFEVRNLRSLIDAEIQRRQSTNES